MSDENVRRGLYLPPAVGDRHVQPISLSNWLELTPNRFCPLHSYWNSSKGRKRSWNLNRPLEEVLAVMAAIVKCVMLRIASGVPHGHVDDTAHYILTECMSSSIGAFRSYKFSCQLIDPLGVDGNASLDKDLSDLRELLFNVILLGEELPNELRQFRIMLEGNLNDIVNRVHVIYNHPSLWQSSEKYIFIETAFMKAKSVRTRTNVDVEAVMRDAMEEAAQRGGFLRMVTNKMGVKEPKWMNKLSKKNPLKKLFNLQQFSSGQNLNNDGWTFYRVVRNFTWHNKDRDSNDQLMHMSDGEIYMDKRFCLVLEEKSKERAHLLYQRKKQLNKLRVKAAEEKLGSQLDVLAPVKY